MNYNYNQYGYGYPNYQGQQYPQPNTGYQQQQINQNLNNYNNYQGMQQQQYQRVKCDFIAVSNLEEVKSFIMQPNTTVLFKDVNNKIIYEKRTDSQGVSEIRAYQEININQNKNNNNQYLTIADFNSFKNDFELRLNNLSKQIQKPIINENTGLNGENNE